MENQKKEFTTVLLKVPDINAAYICLPFDTQSIYGRSHKIKVKATIEEDIEARTVEIPADVAERLSNQPEASAFFSSLSFTNRKEYIKWITGAKKEETRMKRLDQMIGKLLAEQKNPADKG